MILMDYHLHSTHSGDGRSTIEEICRAAVDKGITRIAITDHHDPITEKYTLRDINAYLQEIEHSRELFPQMIIAAGMELDYRPETWKALRGIPKEYGLDFALLSLHYVEGTDPYLPEFFDGITQREGYELYLRHLLNMIRAVEGPWVLGHITYVSKFARFPDTRLRYTDHADMLDELLRLAAQKGLGLEANSSGIANGAGVLPESGILKRFRELGGEIVTVGSDAHSAENVGRWVEESQQAVLEAGFRHLAAYHKLKPFFIKLE